MKLVFLLLLLLIFQLTSCKDEKKPVNQKPSWTQDQSTALNRNLAKQELIKIKLYLKQRPDWKVKDTGSGLKYWIYEDLEGELAKAGDRVEVQFEVRNLKDELYYKTEEGEFSSFKVDKSQVETGVMEGVKLLSEGDQAKFIIPSHIGHGLLGDMNKIPPLEVLVVDLKLVKIH
jgi:gliding motility-associated peptidyl-prolyl isomerase